MGDAIDALAIAPNLADLIKAFQNVIQAGISKNMGEQFLAPVLGWNEKLALLSNQPPAYFTEANLAQLLAIFPSAKKPEGANIRKIVTDYFVSQGMKESAPN